MIEGQEPVSERPESKAALALARSWDQHAKLVDRLQAEDEDELAEKLAACGSPLTLICTCCGIEKTVQTHCRRKWCPVCARMIAAARVARYEAAVDAMRWPLFVTLTRPNVATIDLSIVRGMRRAFGRMRAQKWWAKAVKGGVASIEVTNIGNGWHPHLHAVIDCKWLAVKCPPPKPFDGRPQILARLKQSAREVGERWARTLKLPVANVHIKRAYSGSKGSDVPYGNESIAREVLKYSVKSSDLIKSAEPIGPLIRTLEMCRLVSSWGSCYGSKLTVPDSLREPVPCPRCKAEKSMMPEEVVDRIVRRFRDDRRRGKH